MAYVKQNFVDGDVLNASELNHMEDGIGNAYIKPSGGIPGDDIADEAITTTKYANESVTAEKIADNAVSAVYTATIPTTGWTDYSADSVITISVPGLLTTDNMIIDLVLNDLSSWASAKEKIDSWAGLARARCSTNGKLSLVWDKELKPTTELTAQILCIRK